MGSPMGSTMGSIMGSTMGMIAMGTPATVVAAAAAAAAAASRAYENVRYRRPPVRIFHVFGGRPDPRFGSGP